MQRTASLVLLAAATVPAAAQNEPPRADYELVTTAIHTRRSDTALPVTVLSGDELRDAARATLGDTLAWQPGIANASFGPAVGQPVIRGQQGRRVMNLLDGIPSADAAGNSADHAVGLEPILADGIEVLRGPSTLLYGGGAIGGVVNVIGNRIPDSRPERPALSLEARHDTANDQDSAVGRLDFAAGPLSWHLDGLHREWNDLDIPGQAIDPAWLHDEHAGEEPHEHGEEAGVENTRGYIPHTGGRTNAASVGVSRVFAHGHIGFSTNYLENRYGLPPGAHHHGAAHGDEDDHDHEAGHGEDGHAADPHGDDVGIRLRRVRHDLAGEWREPHALLESLTYRLSYTDYEHSEVEGEAHVSTRFSNKAWQQRLQLTHAELAGWHGVLGWQASDEAFGAEGEESFIPFTDRRSHGIFLVEDYHVAGVTLELGARLGHDSIDPRESAVPGRDYTTRNFSASALWDISAPVSLGLTWSHAERPPSIEELYSNFGVASPGDCVIHFATGACEVGDPDFGEETSRNTDLSLYLEYTTFQATFTLYHNDFSDYIHQYNSGVEVDGFPVRQYRQGDARFTGLELDTTVFLGDHFTLRLFGDLTRGRLDGGGNIPRLPPARLGSQLTYAMGPWSANVSVLHALDQDDPGDNELPTDGYTRWDVGAQYRLPVSERGEMLLFAKARNLGDEEIRLSTSHLRGFAPEPGRSVEVGVRYRF